MTQPTDTTPAAPAPARADGLMQSYAPTHPHTQSTLAPTAEFTRIFLLAWIIRYVFRGGAGVLFEEAQKTPGIRSSILNALSKPGRWIEQTLLKGKVPAKELEAATYAGAVGLGSGYLSYRYSQMVKSDIQNIFGEAVAYENDKPARSITFEDIRRSDNRMVQRTVENHGSKLRGRLATDGLFLGAAALRSGPLTDFFLGLKGVQIFADTWKRKTTMFEDLITFINNKINPRNGLGQAISVGDIFDLYQHYAEAFNPDRMFKNVVERGTGEGVLWAKNQAIFQRITELMNLTYAYKHRSVIDPATGHAVHQADFALPKFIYLLGHDLIDIHKPEETLARIEIANQYGIPAVKEMQTALAHGTALSEILQRYPLATRPPHDEKETPTTIDKNGVIPKGSTMQLNRSEIPGTSITTAGAEHTPATMSGMALV